MEDKLERWWQVRMKRRWGRQRVGSNDAKKGWQA